VAVVVEKLSGQEEALRFLADPARYGYRPTRQFGVSTRMRHRWFSLAITPAVAKLIDVPLQGLFRAASLMSRLARLHSRENDTSDAEEAVARAQERCNPSQIGWMPLDASGAVLEILARALVPLDLPQSQRE
jgi:hypothetical protein